MKTLIYDIECYINFFLVLTFDIKTKEYKKYTLGDNLLNEIILNPEVILVGWNNHNYDDILLNYLANGAQPIVKATGWEAQTTVPITLESIHRLSQRIIRTNELTPEVKQLKYADKKYYSIDIKGLLDPMPGLKKTALRIHSPDILDLPVHYARKVTEREKKILTDYCHDDVNNTYKIYTEHADKHLKLRQYLADRFELPAERLESASEARTAEYILSEIATKNSTIKPWQIKKTKEVSRAIKFKDVKVRDCIPNWVYFNTTFLQLKLDHIRDITLPVNPNTGYVLGQQLSYLTTIGLKTFRQGIGGLHSIDTPGTFHQTDSREIILADVTSYYPSLLLRDQLKPKGYTDVWSCTYHQVYDDRLEAKLDPNRVTEALALKIILNATFGKFGSIYSSFYDPTLLLRITLTGQLALLMLIEKFDECKQIEVISANTDGVIFIVDKGYKDKFYELCKEWETHTKLNLEYTNYERYCRRDVNNYTALKQSGKISNKGVFVKPDIKHDVQAPIIADMARNYMLFDLDPSTWLKEHWSKFTIYDFCFYFTATKDFKIYDCGRQLQKSNRWYLSHNYHNNNLVKKGGKLNNTINIPNSVNFVLCNKIIDPKIPKDLDLSRYIHRAWSLIENCKGGKYGEIETI